LDITDYYVFRGQTGTVFALNVDPSIAGPNAPRGFHPRLATSSASTATTTRFRS